MQYRHIEHLREEVWCQKINFWQKDSFVNLDFFPVCLIRLFLDSAYTEKSTCIRAFTEAFWYFAQTI